MKRLVICIMNLSPGDDHPVLAGPGTLVGMNERAVWVLFDPDLEPEGREPGGWILIIEGPTGLQPGFEIQTPRNFPVPVRDRHRHRGRLGGRSRRHAARLAAPPALVPCPCSSIR